MFYGVDGCRGGWCLAGIDAGAGGFHSLEVLPAFSDVARQISDTGVVFIDMPIGLPDGTVVRRRTCDDLARQALRARAASVFFTPARPVLEAPSFEAASRLQRELTGRGLSRQSWGLAPKIREVDTVLRTPHGDAHAGFLSRIYESHPELCFAGLNGGQPLAWPKRDAAGLLARASLLRPFLGEVWSILHRHLAAIQGAGIDDALDSLVLAVHARLSVRHGFVSLPAEPEKDAFGLPMRIVMANVPSHRPLDGADEGLPTVEKAGRRGRAVTEGTAIWLIRHGETEWNLGGRMQGQTDIPLSPAGEEQARRIAARLRGRAFAAIYSSDLRRAARTAAIIGEAVGRTPVLLTALREADLGQLAGLTTDEVKERYPHLYGANRRPEDQRPGGESDLEHRARVWTAVSALAEAHPGQEVAVVTHAGSVRSTVNAALAMPPGHRLAFTLDNASISVLTYRFGGWNLSLLNDTCHLR